jgi:hypothetical protein
MSRRDTKGEDCVEANMIAGRVSFVWLFALIGCGAEPRDGVWVTANDALTQQGVESWRVTVDEPTHQVVLLKRGGMTAGHVELERGAAWGAFSVEWSGRSLAGRVSAVDRTVTLTSDGHSVTVPLDRAEGSHQALREAEPLATLLRALRDAVPLRAEAAVPENPRRLETSQAMPDGGGLCCTGLPVVGVGWAWWWEAEPVTRGCARARDVADFECRVASLGLPCCMPPVCSDCIDFGTTITCWARGTLNGRC